jgi:hypothetical protein
MASPLCGKTILQVHPSPSRKLSAVVFENDCGATTASNLQIAIQDSSSKVNEENLPSAFFVADADHGKAPRDLNGLPDVKVEWLADDRLRVMRHPRARVFRSDARKDRVAIQYEWDSSNLNDSPVEVAR